MRVTRDQRAGYIFFLVFMAPPFIAPLFMAPPFIALPFMAPELVAVFVPFVSADVAPFDIAPPLFIGSGLLVVLVPFVSADVAGSDGGAGRSAVSASADEIITGTVTDANAAEAAISKNFLNKKRFSQDC